MDTNTETTEIINEAPVVEENTTDETIVDQTVETNTEETTEEANTESKAKKSLFDNLELDKQEKITEEFKEVFGEDFEDNKDKIAKVLEKYSKDGEVDTKQLVKALINANKVLGSKQVEVPEEYNLELSEDLKDFQVNEDTLGIFNSIAKEAGLSNEQHNKIVNTFVKQNKDLVNNIIETENKKIDAEIESIEGFKDRASNIHNRLRSTLGDESKVLLNTIYTKEHFEVLEKLVNKLSVKSNPIVDDTNVLTGKLLDKKIDELTAKIYEAKDVDTRQKLEKERLDLIKRNS